MMTIRNIFILANINEQELIIMNEETKKIFDDFKKEMDKLSEERKESFEQVRDAIRECRETVDYYLKLVGAE